MRTITKPSTAHCNIEMYVRYLLSEPQRTSCTGLEGVVPNLSHDSVNRFLLREDYSPEDLRKEVIGKIDINGGVLSVDDMVLDKPYSDPKKADLIGHFYSGKHHAVVKGINLVTLFYTDIEGVSVPVNFRIVEPSESTTKNELFRTMLAEVLAWGLNPGVVTGDCWYSSLENLKFIRKCGLGMLFGIEANRTVSLEKGSYCQVQKIENWDSNGVIVYLKDYGMVKVFREKCKNAYRYYIVALPSIDQLDNYTQGDFDYVHSRHWNIERFHRATKQLCSIEKFQVRTSTGIQNHIFCSLIGFVKLETARVSNVIKNWYQLKKALFIDVVRDFIASGIDGIVGSKLMPSVNA